jgi:CheY-like chemotaxis protein
MQGNSARTALVKALVADDEEIIADSLAAILTHAGYETRAVYSGKEAVETALTFQPNLLICDIVMAAISGIDAAIEVRAKLPSCNIFLLSGRAEMWGLLEKARRQGHEFELISKPIHPTELLAKLASSASLQSA